MKQKLQPGAELDLLTESEVRKIVEEVTRGLTLQPARVRGVENGQTTAAGALTLPFYKVPGGMGFHLTRLLVRSDGASFDTPFTGAGARLEVLRDEFIIDGKSLVAGAATPDGYAGLPALFTYGEDASAWFANESQAAIRLAAGPVSTNVLVAFEGILRPFVAGN